MARFSKFNGVLTLPGVTTPQVIADTAVGEAREGLGAQIGRTVSGLARLAGKSHEQNAPRIKEVARVREQNSGTFELLKSQVKLNASMREAEAEQRQRALAGERAYSETLLARRRDAEQAMIKDLPPEMQILAGERVRQKEPDYLAHLAEQEYADDVSYYRQSAAEIFELLAEEVRLEPRKFPEIDAVAAEVVASTPIAGAQKAVLSRHAEEALASAWIEGQPLSEQIRHLKEDEDPGKTTDRGDVATNADRARKQEGVAETDSEIVALLGASQRNNLLTNAYRNLAIESLREEERIVSRLSQDPFSVRQRDIQRNDLLSEFQKQKLSVERETQAKEQVTRLSVANWLVSTEAGNQFEPDHQFRTDKAFALFEEGDVREDDHIRGIVNSKGIVPGSFVARVLNIGPATPNDEIGRDHETLQEIASLNDRAVEFSGKTRDLQKRLNIWVALTRGSGLSPEVAARRIAHGISTEDSVATTEIGAAPSRQRVLSSPTEEVVLVNLRNMLG